MGSRYEDEAWREIVSNYGPEPKFYEPEPEPALPPEPHEHIPWVEDRFVPPNPPPVPMAPPKRQLAWLGIFVAPLILLVGLVSGANFPSWLSLLLVVWFVGGFAYLVSQMPKGPRDPGDDGARL